MLVLLKCEKLKYRGVPCAMRNAAAPPPRPTAPSTAFALSRYPYLHPHLHRAATDWAILHQGRAIAARALVTAWHRDLRLGVGEADDARRLATDGGLGSLRSAGVEPRIGERRHGGGRWWRWRGAGCWRGVSCWLRG
eukprot:scaffold93114_cov64-Phaeocystis_antarctica.AAC.4